MIKQFIAKSLTYSGSTFAFSGIRQLCFFPFWDKLDTSAFTQLIVLIFLFESLLYGTGGSIADYYVKAYNKDDFSVLPKLSLFCLSGFIFFPYFLFVLSSLVLALLSSFYLCLGALVQLLHKPLFNRLEFKQNYVYVTFKTLPYIATCLFMLQDYEHSPLYVFIPALAVTELVYLSRLINKLPLDVTQRFYSFSNIFSGFSPRVFKSLLFFGIAYISMGVVQRGDLLLGEHLFGTASIETFAKFFAVAGFFCNSIGVFFSAPLVSFINNKNIDVNSAIKHFLLPSIVLSIFVGIASSVSFPWIIRLLYGDGVQLSAIGVAVYVSFAVIYLTVRPLMIMFNKTLSLLSVNLLVITLNVALAFLYDFTVLGFAFTYSVTRAVLCTIFFLKGLCFGKN